MNTAPRQAQRYLSWLLPCVAFALLLVEPAWAQQPPHWRVWKDPSEPPPARITVWINVTPPNETVLLSQLTLEVKPVVVQFDGYEAASLPETEFIQTPRQGLSGETWAISCSGEPWQTVSIDRYVYDHDLNKGEWIQHDLEDISFLDTTTLPLAR